MMVTLNGGDEYNRPYQSPFTGEDEDFALDQHRRSDEDFVASVERALRAGLGLNPKAARLAVKAELGQVAL